MHKRVSFNHKITDPDDVSIAAITNAGLYGKGVFTTMAIRDGLPFLFDKHWKRLNSNAEFLRIDLSGLSKENLFSSLMVLLDQNAVGDGRCRVTLFDESRSSVWSGSNSPGTSVLIQTGDVRKRPAMLSVSISKFGVTSGAPLNNVKSCNYLERLVAYEHAAAAGFDEAVRLNEYRQIVSGAMSNIFWFKDGKLFTPSLETGCLEGTTREYIIDKYRTVEVESGIKSLLQADSVFLTSAGLAVTVVRELFAGDETVGYQPLPLDFTGASDIQRLIGLGSK